MKVRNLYQLLFATKVKDLKPALIADAEARFKVEKDNKRFEAALLNFNPALAREFFKDPTQHGYFYIPGEDTMQYAFTIWENETPYFKYADQTKIFAIFKALYLTLHVINQIYFDGSASIAHMAYKILLLFGSDYSIDKTLAAFDDYCTANQLTAPKDWFSELDRFHYPNQDEIASDLNAWRKLFIRYGLKNCELFFYHAKKIEAQLGRGPKTLEEAENALRSVKYKRAEEFPELAAICTFNFISEELFNACLDADEKKGGNVYSSICSKLPLATRMEFIQLVASQLLKLELEKILDIFTCFTTEKEQLELLGMFQSPLLNINKNQLGGVLRYLNSAVVQQKYFDLLGPEKIKQLIGQHYDLAYATKQVHLDLREDFLWKIIGKEVILGTVKTPHDYREFLANFLPINNQVEFLKTSFGIEKLQRLTENFCHLAEQLKCLAASECYPYVAEIMQSEKLKALLLNNWVILKDILILIPSDDKTNFLLKLVGEEALRKIFSDTTKSSQIAFASALPQDQQAIFLDALLTPAEKEARAALRDYAEKIAKESFVLGPRGWGFSYSKIKLKDGTEKPVPNFVYMHWNLIMRAEEGYGTYTDALAEVKRICSTIVEQPFSYDMQGLKTFFTRSRETVQFAQAFLDKHVMDKTFSPRPT